jgi:chemotaxis protein CheC
MDGIIQLNDMEKDALREVGNVGTGNAATALSKMINKKVAMIIPNTEFVPIKKFAQQVGGEETIVTSVYLQIIGDVSGEALLMFPKEDSIRMVDMMMGQAPGTSKIIDEMGQSAINELANIFVGAYLNSLADLLKLRIMPNIPHFTIDMTQAVMDFILIKISNYADNVLSIKTDIKIEEVEVAGTFILVFDVESLTKILSVLKKMYSGE